jgi:uncharacterized repeat protein (TIGR03943 family)
VRRETQNTVLLLVGVALLMTTLTGTYTRYVKPSMLPWLVAAAVVILLLALSAILINIRHGHYHGGDHDGHAHRAGIVWLLAIPIVVLIFVVPPALSARAVAPSLVVIPPNVLRQDFPPLPNERAPTLSLREVLLRIATDSAHTLDGRLITVNGFTMKNGEQTDLTQIVIVCCAADAQLIGIRLAGPAAAAAASYPEYTWLSMEGTVPPGQHPRRSKPVLEVTRVTPIERPRKNPYG